MVWLWFPSSISIALALDYDAFRILLASVLAYLDHLSSGSSNVTLYLFVTALSGSVYCSLQTTVFNVSETITSLLAKTFGSLFVVPHLTMVGWWWFSTCWGITTGIIAANFVSLIRCRVLR